MIDQPKTSIHAVGHALRESARGTTGAALFLSDLSFVHVMPFLRRNLGENYFSPFLILMMGIFVIGMSMVMKINPTFIAIYLGLLAVASIYHSLVIRKRNKNDEPFFSWGEGDFNIDPLVKKLPFGDDYWVKESVYEPLIVLVTGIVIHHLLDAGLGSLLMISAPMMTLRSLYAKSLNRKALLAARDQQILAEQKVSALQGKPSSETKGYIVKNVNNMRPHDKEALAKQMLNEKDFASLSSTSKA